MVTLSALDDLMPIFIHRFITTVPNKQDLVIITIDVNEFASREVNQFTTAIKKVKGFTINKNNDKVVVSYDMMDYHAVRKAMQPYIVEYVELRNRSDK